MWFKIKLFFQFLLKSTNQHGVHSPFVFSLVTKCFYKKTSSEKLKLFKEFRNYLLSKNEIISITDFGKGSTVFKSNQRRISDIVKVAGISSKKAKLLINLIEYFQPKNILELGTSVGLSSALMSSSENNITTLEGCPETAAIAEELHSKFSIKNIDVQVGDFKEILPKNIENNTFNFIYIDGNHSKKATLTNFELCLNSIDNNSFIIFDDINWSKEMQNAWNEIKNHSAVTVTIDLYFWGIVFFRKEQTKQHFTIRT